MNTTYDYAKDVLKHPFSGYTKVFQNYSQAYQDLFVLSMLKGKKNGKYVEIGSNDPQYLSNTFLLETAFDWRGFSVEIDKTMCELFRGDMARTNTCYEADATTFDYVSAILKEKWKNRVDYLSIDCEPPHVTLSALEQFPFDDFKVSVITFEHDVYKDGCVVMDTSREFLSNKGYQLVCKNVCNGQRPYEDWWVDPSIVKENVWKPFECEGEEARNIFI
tara:strand:+ start:126 stop:782 length:657 start_codon:yes stop_codon:yes gene_type:complete